MANRLNSSLWLFLAGLLGILSLTNWSSGIASAEGPVRDAEAKFFREKIEPVLKKECFSCHSAQAKEIKGGLRLDTRNDLRKGGDSGAVLVKGKAEKSLLVQAIRHEGDLAMPPEKPKLSAQIIADFTKWIEMGAPDPREEVSAGNASQDDPRRHWAFQPVRKVIPPEVQDRNWPRSPLDNFTLVKLEERNWSPAPPASRAKWLRRVSFDLVGLPPSPEEIAHFESDDSADGFEKVVDRLLASPRYGERWAQHWLDVVRYAETEGYEYDRHVPDAWRFRDYVITLRTIGVISV